MPGIPLPPSGDPHAPTEALLLEDVRAPFGRVTALDGLRLTAATGLMSHDARACRGIRADELLHYVAGSLMAEVTLGLANLAYIVSLVAGAVLRPLASLLIWAILLRMLARKWIS